MGSMRNANLLYQVLRRCNRLAEKISFLLHCTPNVHLHKKDDFPRLYSGVLLAFPPEHPRSGACCDDQYPGPETLP